MDKTFLLQQLGERLRAAVVLAHKSGAEARADARSGAQRAVNLAKAQTERELGAKAALDALNMFRPKVFKKNEPLGVGAVVELEDGECGRTLFIAPVGAGEELTGPDGDGIFQVVTPSSPFGKALLGKRVGDVVEVPVRGEVTEWTITYAT